jgi:hypothetical protein
LIQNCELFQVLHVGLFQEEQQGRGRKRLVFVIISIGIYIIMDKLSKPPEMSVRANLPLLGFNKPCADVGETICISSVSILTILKHGRASLPLKVMGLMFTSVVAVCLFICFDYIIHLCCLSLFN